MKVSPSHDTWVRNVGKDTEKPSLAAPSIMQSFLCSLTDKTEPMRKTILVTEKRLDLMSFPFYIDLA